MMPGKKKTSLSALAAALGREGGKAKTPAKKAAAAKNAKLGGRPKGSTNRCPKCGHGWKHTEHQTICKLDREGK